MGNHYFRLFCFICLLGGSHTLTAQLDDRMSAYQVMQQDSFMAAIEYFNSGKLNEAETALRNLIAQDHTEPAFEFMLAKVYWNKKEQNEAVNHAQKAAMLDAGNIWYRLLEAEFLDQSGRTGEATAKYEKIVADFPRVQEYWIRLSRLYQSQGRTSDAISIYDRMMTQFGESDELLLRKALTLAETGDLKGAIQAQTRVVERNPDNTGFKNNLASLYSQAGDTATAFRLFREVLAVDRNDSRANIALAETMKRNSQNEKYLDAISTLMANKEINIDIKVSELVPYLQRFISKHDTALGRALIRSGQQLQAAHSDSPKAHALMGDIYFHNGEYLAANEAYDKSLGLTKKVYAVFQQKMLILQYLKRYDEQITFTESAMDAYPNQVAPYFYQAFAYLRTGKIEDAASDLRQAMIIAGRNNPMSAAVAALHAVIAAGKNDKENALKLKENAISMAGAQPAPRNEVAELWADFGMWLNEAGELNELALQADPTNPFYQATAARLAFRQNNHKQAKIAIDQALVNSGYIYPPIVELAGDIAIRQGDAATALEYWNRAKKMGVSSTVLAQKINQKMYKAE